MCWDMLKGNFISSAMRVNLWRRWRFQHDNDPKHTAKITREGFAWPNQSPDLILWGILKLQVHRRNPDNLGELNDLPRGMGQYLPTMHNAES